MNKGPEVKETAFLYFHISLFACSHNMCSPASDENPLHSDTCDREANNQICGKYRKAVSFTSYCIGSARKRIVAAAADLISYSLKLLLWFWCHDFGNYAVGKTDDEFSV